MKNIEKYIYIAIIIILVGIVASLTTYMIIKNNDKPEIKEENRPNQDNKPTEQITLSEEKLKAYLEYVPNDVIDAKQSVYRTPNNINNIKLSTLIGATIDYADRNFEIRLDTETGDEFLYKKEDIEKLLMKLYNQKIGNLVESEEKTFAEFSCSLYYYNNNMIRVSGGCGYDGSHISLIDSYNANEKELIIYEYAAEDFNYLDNNNGTILVDYYTNRKYQLNYKLKNEEAYLKEHKTEFTKYKHTFKKNNTGYYWYSTEVV